MSDTDIQIVITSAFNSKPILAGIDLDQDFFDLGASSLTVVELQIQVEQELAVQVETSKLMLNPTINGWIDTYSKRANG